MSKRTESFDMNLNRLRIRSFIDAGCSVSKAAKEIGVTYKHAKRMADEYLAEKERDEQEKGDE